MLDIIGLILGILGLFGAPAIVWFVKDRIVLWWYASRGDEETIRNRLLEVIARRASPFPAVQNVGTYAEVLAGWFIDFLSAVTDLKDRVILERCLTRWVFLSLARKGYDARSLDRIAVPKLGNVLLADLVARRLGRPLLIVRQEQRQYVLPGQVFEGDRKPGDRVVLIDDVSSDSEFLARCVQELRKANLDILGVFTLLDRKEGDCHGRMASLGVAFAALHSMGDPDIVGCRAKYR